MNTKTLLVLGLATAGLFAAAVMVNRQKEGALSPTREAGRKLFPALASNVNAVVALEVTSKDGVVKLAKDGERWGMSDKGGYPVDFDKVKQIVVAVSDFEIVGEMSKNPANFKKLGVQAVGEEGSESKQLTLKDKSGAVLADVIIGQNKVTQGYGGKQQLFVRPASGDQPYQVTGQVNLFGDASSWMKRDICKIESNRVREVVIAHADGARLAIKKQSAEDKDFLVQDLPEGEELMWSGAANGIGGALQYLSLEDVKAAAEMTLESPTVAEFTTFDGLRITARSTEADGKTWLALAASFDESLRVEPAGPPTPAGEGDEAPPPPPSTLKPIDEVRKEAEELNAQFSRWVYGIPGYSGANFRKRMADLLKNKDSGSALDPQFDPGIDSPQDDQDGGDEVDNPAPVPPLIVPPVDQNDRDG